MTTEFYKLSGELTSPENTKIFARGGEIIRRGGLVAFPTETVYGLGANALDANAAKRIYSAKGRPSDNPLILHIAHVEDAEKYCHTSELFYKLAERFMPGPLTVVLPKRDIVPLTVTGGLKTAAIRLPSSEPARALIEAAGIPIAAPSANISGKPSPTCAAHVYEDMNGRIDMIIDGGDCEVGVESTIVSLADGHMTLLRPGGITLEMLEELGEVRLDRAILERLKDGERPLAPGMKYRHYAPATKVVLVDSSAETFVGYAKNEAEKIKLGVIIEDALIPEFESSGIPYISIGSGLGEEAHNLFAALRDTDRLGCELILSRLPSKEGIGLAVYNRFVKAAGYEIITPENKQDKD